MTVFMLTVGNQTPRYYKPKADGSYPKALEDRIKFWTFSGDHNDVVVHTLEESAAVNVSDWCDGDAVAIKHRQQLADRRANSRTGSPLLDAILDGPMGDQFHVKGVCGHELENRYDGFYCPTCDIGPYS